MKVKKLIEILQTFPSNAFIEVAWEGIFRDIEKNNVYIHEDGTILIDADNNRYKNRIMKGEWYYSNNILRKMNQEHKIRT